VYARGVKAALPNCERTSRRGRAAWQWAAILVGGYSAAAVVTAIATQPAAAAARPLPEAIRDLWLAAMIWAALTAGIALLVRAYPASRLGYRRAAVVYGAVICSATWIVNGAFLLAHAAAGAVEPGRLPSDLVSMSLGHLPFNAAVAIALVAAFHWKLATRETGTIRAAADALSTADGCSVEGVTVTAGVRQFVVPVDSIEWLEAADDYVLLHCAGKSHICSDRLYRLEEKLGAAGFVRVHRSALVNLHRVRAVIARSPGGMKLELSSGRTVAVSRRRQGSVRRAVLSKAPHQQPALDVPASSAATARPGSAP
jgi:hypothetical protein